MQIIHEPERSSWAGLTARPAFDVTTLFGVVRPILDAVRERGDAALREYEAKFDHVELADLRVGREEMDAAEARVAPDLRESIRRAYANIAAFHSAQRFGGVSVTTAPGVRCEQRGIPVSRVGLYVPGGSAPLFSTVLMLGVPARIAGCRHVVLCTPPSRDGSVNPVILFTARLCGITQVYKVGGAQAVAAMACGTETVPRVDKIFGPGNQYVMAAKQLVSLSGVGIDMPAGPSEVEVLADDTCNPAFVAADLLSQAEHGPDSQAVLVVKHAETAAAVAAEVERQLAALPRRDIAARALENSRIIVLADDRDAIDFTNAYAPEHLILAVADPHAVAAQVEHAGSVFLGHYSCESAGDYASGTNHTLPTLGYARSFGGLCLDSFIRKTTFQELTAEGVRSIGPAVEKMAAAEMLDAHRNAMTLRLAAVGQGGGAPAFDLEALVRPNIRALAPYSSARDEYAGKEAHVFLDANESPYNTPYNRYPDPLQKELKARISTLKGVPADCIFLGNGSDEAIDLVYRVFCTPGVDNVVAPDPTYGMYAVCADINGVEYRTVSLGEDYAFSADALLARTDANTKAVFLCSPNNPSGNLFPHAEIMKVLQQFRGMVVVDEAYGDFAPEASVRPLVAQYPNLMVLSTFSKAWACAGIRLGMAFASPQVVSYFNKVKYPYNVNVLTQQAALEMLDRAPQVQEWVDTLLQERSRVMQAVEQLPACSRVFPSDANFFLARIADATQVYDALIDRGIVVRNRSRIHLCSDCLRITIGTPQENDTLLAALADITK